MAGGHGRQTIRRGGTGRQGRPGSHDSGGVLVLPGWASKALSQGHSWATKSVSARDAFTAAATRNMVSAEKWTQRMNRWSAEHPHAGALAKRMAAYRMLRAEKNTFKAGRMTTFTDRRLLPERVQKALGWSPARYLNRLRGGAVNPSVTRLATTGRHARTAVNPEMKRVGGLGGRAAENTRRVATKFSGPLTAALGTLDVANQVRHHVPVSEAVGKTGSTMAVSTLASSATMDLLAGSAMVPGGGWVLAGGIGASLAASYGWEKLGMSRRVGKLAKGATHWVGHTAAPAVSHAVGGAAHTTRRALSSGWHKATGWL